MHTLTHTDTHQHHQNGTRDEVKKKGRGAEEGRERERTSQTDTKTAHTREKNLVVEQRTKDPHKFSHSSQKISRNKKEGKWERPKKKRKTNKQLIG